MIQHERDGDGDFMAASMMYSFFVALTATCIAAVPTSIVAWLWTGESRYLLVTVAAGLWVWRMVSK